MITLKLNTRLTIIQLQLNIPQLRVKCKILFFFKNAAKLHFFYLGMVK